MLIFTVVSPALHKEDVITEEQLKVTAITNVNPFASVIFCLISLTTAANSLGHLGLTLNGTIQLYNATHW